MSVEYKDADGVVIAKGSEQECKVRITVEGDEKERKLIIGTEDCSYAVNTVDVEKLLWEVPWSCK